MRCMTGPVHRRKYTSDDGHVYAIPVPDWQEGIAGNTMALADGTEDPTPHSFRARYRMIQNTATGREKKVKVGVLTGAFWTNPMGHDLGAVDDGTTAGIAAAIEGGRIGERVLNR